MPENRTDPVADALVKALPDAVAARHHLHRHPELSQQEEQTAAFVAERLRALGLDEVRTGVGGHGVIGVLKGRAAGAEDGPTFALRADMDALPIQEESDLPYKSCVPGVMHACGHDGHTATLLGAAATLAPLRENLRGTARFLFQPAEENVTGAERMCAEGAMEGVDAIVALHGWPGLEVGSIGVRSGPVMASSDTFQITVQGRGCHAAMPHLGVDPIVVGAQLVLALQTLASREISPTESVVVTVAQFHAGAADNIISPTAVLDGTVRCLTETLRAEMPARIERVVAGVCAAMRAEYAFLYRHGTGVTVNDAQISALVKEVGETTLGAGKAVTLEAPSMGAEDFSVYLRYAPGAMFWLGVGQSSPNLHNPRYNFADEALPHGMALFSHLALRYLNGEREPGR